jgi:hypothetical protein
VPGLRIATGIIDCQKLAYLCSADRDNALSESRGIGIGLQRACDAMPEEWITLCEGYPRSTRNGRIG